MIDWNKSLSEPVEIRVNVQHEDVAALSRRAGIYLHTTNPAEPFGMPVSISEAMATGAYLIGRRLPAAAAYIGDAGALYESPAEAAQLIHQTLQWSKSQWQQARTRSIDRAYGCFAHTEVLAPLVEHWHQLAVR